jgi:hypothetical protein
MFTCAELCVSAASNHEAAPPAEDLRDRGRIDLSETFIDASFSSAKKGALLSANSPRQRQQNHGDRRPPWSSCRL